MLKRKKKKLPVKLTARRQVNIIKVQLFVLAFTVAATRCSAPLETAGYPAGTVASKYIASLEIPATPDAEFLIHNETGRYCIYYDTAHRQAAWTAYTLTRHDVESKNSERRNRFAYDPAVKGKGWPYSVSSDYGKSGYDRGHLLPSADRNGTQPENDATFLMSNISPQNPKLNRGTWRALETEIRHMASRMDTVYIVTGTIINDEPERIGKNRVSVPGHFFKVLLAKKEGEYISIGFVIPNHDLPGNNFWSYSATVDDVEELSGYDFFYNLPDDLEETAERQYDINHWRR